MLPADMQDGLLLPKTYSCERPYITNMPPNTWSSGLLILGGSVSYYSHTN